MLIINFRILQQFRRTIYQFAKRNSKRISSLMILSKMFSVVLVFTLVPMGTFSKAQNTYNANNAKQTAVKLDINNPFLFSQPNKTLKITTGRSRADLRTLGLLHDTGQIKLLIQEYAPEYGVDWRLVYAIGYLESGNFNSSLARSQNNFFGRKASSGGYASWGSPEEAIRNQFEYLKSRYIERGMNTPWEMNRVYAESPTWASKVVSIMNSL